MPELPEVEAARKRLASIAAGKRIKSVTTTDDSIVFSGTTHTHFATALEGKTVKAVRRRGKCFYMVLADSTLHPVLHFGMSGMAHVRGQPSPVYRVPRSASPTDDWPPKYMKAALVFEDPATGATSDWAFCDPRRLGRIKLVEAAEGDVEREPPLSELGADPLLDMPPVDVLRTALARRSAPIKAVLLDQNGPLCGIGNYLVDEILYQAAIHPSVPASYLALPDQSALFDTLHTQIRTIVETAVAADADASKFPQSWLFQHRWSKGKKKKDDDLGFTLPNGRKATISFVTVGGRTSAVVDEVQVLPPDLAATAAKKRAARATPTKKRKVKVDEGSEDGASDEDVRLKEGDDVTSPHFKRAKKLADSPSPTKRRRRLKPKEEDEDDEQ
ncbi:uncharacterized protein RHOBADRAFT_52681 [Rhodotorula graminis WP1]|uniref:Formamidopyrimidine-DNA glycosylase catalytic domain-containing protein n=1 Tax=Rhodotorula graminis (strain WP1) TaxID=578459 RepID=A0A194S547_RHOGW|nr:uncharacterized protein RHOBADRAFT_52681 [Rhodotorula graminis WP1]KPV75635.1 hypothetical protein RHOBADRAFT_52681 [Rhodotorula graminis WP1]